MKDTQNMVPLKDLNLTNRFLFDETMEDPETHQAALSIIFSKDVGLLPQNEVEKQLQTAPYLKSVRLDVFAIDEDDVVYNTEMQQWRKTDLRRRSRFYQALIDSSLLPAGSINYNLLKDSYIIMITPFDLFGLEKYRYTFKTVCVEEPELFLEDGAVRIFLNTKGKNKNEVSEELIEFLEYVENSNDETAERVKSELVKQIHKRVSEIKGSEEIGVKYMQAWEEKAYEREEGREEGELRKVVGQISQKMQKGLDATTIADHLEESVEFVEKVSQLIKEHPEADKDGLVKLLNNREEREEYEIEK